MPAYEICYLDDDGALTYKFSADCDDDQRAKVLAHAMKLPSAKRLEVWSGEALIYTRPSVIGVERRCCRPADSSSFASGKDAFAFAPSPGSCPGRVPSGRTIRRSPLR